MVCVILYLLYYQVRFIGLILCIIIVRVTSACSVVYRPLVSEPNPLRPLRDLQYGLGEMVFGGCRHLEYMNIWCFNEPK